MTPTTKWSNGLAAGATGGWIRQEHPNHEVVEGLPGRKKGYKPKKQ